MEKLNQREQLLKILYHKERIPVVRFELRSSKDPGLCSLALNHVYLTDSKDTMEKVKANAAVLQELQEQGLVFINYRLGVTVKRDYKIYGESELYRFFCHTVEESRKNPSFLFDTPRIKRGEVTLTAKGKIETGHFK